MKRIALVLGLILIVSGSSSAAEQPADRAVRRAKGMKQAIRQFGLHLYFHGDADKPYYRLTLSVQGGWNSSDPNFRQARITAGQAEAIIDHLLADGFLDRAVHAERFIQQSKLGYHMRVHIDDNGVTEDLGWGLPMLKRLDGLRKVLKGDAAKEMDVLLDRFAEQRKEWEQDSKTSMKGWELYVWQEKCDTFFSLLRGTNRLKTDDDITKEAVKGIEAIKPKLNELKSGEAVSVVGKKLMEQPPKDQATEIVDYGKKIGLKVQEQSE